MYKILACLLLIASPILKSEDLKCRKVEIKKREYLYCGSKNSLYVKIRNRNKNALIKSVIDSDIKSHYPVGVTSPSKEIGTSGTAK